MWPLFGLGVLAYLFLRPTAQAIEGAAQASAQAANAGGGAAEATEQAAEDVSHTLQGVQPGIASANAALAANAQTATAIANAANLFTAQAQALGLNPAQTQHAYESGMTPSQYAQAAQGVLGALGQGLG